MMHDVSVPPPKNNNNQSSGSQPQAQARSFIGSADDGAADADEGAHSLRGVFALLRRQDLRLCQLPLAIVLVAIKVILGAPSALELNALPWSVSANAFWSCGAKREIAWLDLRMSMSACQS
jgi:hypothetical protein